MPTLICLPCRRPWLDSRVGKIHWRRDRLPTPVFLGFPCGSAGKESTCKAGGLGSIPGLGRSPGEVKGYPLQYSGVENPNSICGDNGEPILHLPLSSKKTPLLSLMEFKTGLVENQGFHHCPVNKASPSLCQRSPQGEPVHLPTSKSSKRPISSIDNSVANLEVDYISIR